MSTGKRLVELDLQKFQETQVGVEIPWVIKEEFDSDLDGNEAIVDIESDAETTHSSHSTNSEQSVDSVAEEDGFDISKSCQLKYIGRDNCTLWLVHPPIEYGRTRQRVIHLPAVKSSAKGAKLPIDCWKLFFSSTMIQEIVNCTNIYLQYLRPHYGRERDCRDTDEIELLAFLGLLYMAGLKKGHHLNTKEFWIADGTEPSIFRLTMSRERFHLILRAIRFDDINSRAERAKRDNLAPIRGIFEEFVDKCQKNYQVGECTTIIDMLEGFRDRSKSRQYISNIPAKYGIKIYALVDSKIFYTANMEIGAGKQPEGPYRLENSARAVVKRLVKPILCTGRNITMDNHFTSVPLAIDLLRSGTTIVGTILKNKKEIPPIFVNVKDRPIMSSMFAFMKDVVLVSYKPKRNKNLLLLSTLHSEDRIDKDSDKLKPEIVTYYNMTRGGVDMVDELKSLYSVPRISNRWPLTVFFSLLNIGGINSQIMFKENTGNIQQRRMFLKTLAMELMKPHLIRRSKIPNLSFQDKIQIKQISGVTETLPSTSKSLPGFCAFCPRRKNRKTLKRCLMCYKYVCTEHVKLLCVECQNENCKSD